MSEMTYVLRPKRKGNRIPKAIAVFKTFPTPTTLLNYCDHDGEYELQPRERKGFCGKVIHFTKTTDVEYVPQKKKKHWWRRAKTFYAPVEKQKLNFCDEELLMEYNRLLGKEHIDEENIKRLAELIPIEILL